MIYSKCWNPIFSFYRNMVKNRNYKIKWVRCSYSFSVLKFYELRQSAQVLIKWYGQYLHIISSSNIFYSLKDRQFSFRKIQTKIWINWQWKYWVHILFSVCISRFCETLWKQTAWIIEMDRLQVNRKTLKDRSKYCGLLNMRITLKSLPGDWARFMQHWNSIFRLIVWTQIPTAYQELFVVFHLW